MDCAFQRIETRPAIDNTFGLLLLVFAWRRVRRCFLRRQLQNKPGKQGYTENTSKESAAM